MVLKTTVLLMSLFFVRASFAESPLTGNYIISTAEKNNVACNRHLEIKADERSLQLCADFKCGQPMDTIKQGRLHDGPSSVCYESAANAGFVSPTHWHNDFDLRCFAADEVAFQDIELNASQNTLTRLYKDFRSPSASVCHYIRTP